jgi:hypothetical protein
MPDQHESAKRRNEQARRAEHERELAREDLPEEERHAHERRAEKAEYLREKLEEQRQAPDE